MKQVQAALKTAYDGVCPVAYNGAEFKVLYICKNYVSLSDSLLLIVSLTQGRCSAQ
jgi:hypothetical protein